MSEEVGTSLLTYIVYGVGVIVLISLIVSSFFTIEQKHVGIIQRFGKFLRIANPGLNFKIPLIDQVVEELSLKIEELVVEVETKTKDNVFVKMNVSVQYSVITGREKEAYYELTSPDEQIESYVFDVVRAEVPKTALDEVFEKKDTIAEAIRIELTETMEDYGFKIYKALVTNIDPDQKVKDAMNDINAAQRLKIAATEKGEADKILTVKKAEAECESKILQGRGMAGQREEIAKGLKKSVEMLKDATGVKSEEIMQLLLSDKYYDTLKEMAQTSDSKVIFTSTSPTGFKDLTSQITEGVIAADAVKDKPVNISEENKNIQSDQPEIKTTFKEEVKKEERKKDPEGEDEENDNEEN
jgi:regulator of protease activity HflC (stomatin/prohibitin superfamily)